jgi:hypothetical protein
LYRRFPNRLPRRIDRNALNDRNRKFAGMKVSSQKPAHGAQLGPLAIGVTWEDSRRVEVWEEKTAVRPFDAGRQVRLRNNGG